MAQQGKQAKARGFDVWLAIGRTNLKVHRALNSMLDRLDLSLAQHEILLTIRGHSGLTQKQLSDRLLVVKSNVTALIKKLEARGLVAREVAPTDLRNKHLSLTPAGEALVLRSLEVQNQLVRVMASETSDTELAELAAIMERVDRAIDRFLDAEETAA